MNLIIKNYIKRKKLDEAVCWLGRRHWLSPVGHSQMGGLALQISFGHWVPMERVSVSIDRLKINPGLFGLWSGDNALGSCFHSFPAAPVLPWFDTAQKTGELTFDNPTPAWLDWAQDNSQRNLLRHLGFGGARNHCQRFNVHHVQGNDISLLLWTISFMLTKIGFVSFVRREKNQKSKTSCPLITTDNSMSLRKNSLRMSRSTQLILSLRNKDKRKWTTSHPSTQSVSLTPEYWSNKEHFLNEWASLSLCLEGIRTDSFHLFKLIFREKL